MKNDISEKDRFDFLGRCRALLENKMYEDVMTLAEERLKMYSTDTDAYAMLGEVLAGTGSKSQMENLLGDVEKKITDLSMVYLWLKSLYKETDEKKRETDLMKTLTDWLYTIQRMKIHAAKRK